MEDNFDPASLNLDSIKNAEKILHQSDHFKRTPLIKNCEKSSPRIKELGCKFHIKLESTQVTGSFKIRGLIPLMEELKKDSRSANGLISMSAGNFGRSFAYITSKLGLKASVVMPDNVPKDRIVALESYGTRVLLGPRIALQPIAEERVKNENLFFVHPFDDPRLFHGYGTVGTEILQDLPEADIVVVGVGGGGWISGVAAAIKLSNPKVKVIGVEPTGASAMYQSVQKGQPVSLQKIETFVNGLAPPYAGKNAYEIVKRYVDEIVLVEDDQVKDAMKLLYNDQKVVVEPAGAACVAALLYQKLGDISNKNVVCVVSGGNISIEDLANVFAQ